MLPLGQAMGLGGGHRKDMGGSSSSWGIFQARWLVYFMENPKIPNKNMDDDWGYPYDETETTHMDDFHSSDSKRFAEALGEWY